MANSKRDEFILKCSECGDHNYITKKNKKNTPDKLERKKYCKKCGKVTVHTEHKKLK